MNERRITGIGRDGLLELVDAQRETIARLVKERNAYLRSLTSTQERCTDLVMQVRELKERVQYPLGRDER